MLVNRLQFSRGSQLSGYIDDRPVAVLPIRGARITVFEGCFCPATSTKTLNASIFQLKSTIKDCDLFYLMLNPPEVTLLRLFSPTDNAFNKFNIRFVPRFIVQI